MLRKSFIIKNEKINLLAFEYDLKDKHGLPVLEILEG